MVKIQIFTKHKKLTHCTDFLPIPIVKMVIQRVSPGTRSHFTSARRNGIYVSPPTLWSFTICPSNTLDEVERKVRLTFCYMGRQVKFRHEKGDEFLVMPDVILVREVRHACPEVLAPLTCNVIRDVQPQDVRRGLHTREEQVIHVEISVVT
jgi:hypothetical protein